MTKKVRKVATAIALTLMLSAGLDMMDVGDELVAIQAIAQEKPEGEASAAEAEAEAGAKKTKKQLKAEKKAAQKAAKRAKKEAKRAAKEAAEQELAAKNALALDPDNEENATLPVDSEQAGPEGEGDEASLDGEGSEGTADNDEGVTDADGENDACEGTDEGEGTEENAEETVKENADEAEIDLSKLSIAIKSTLGKQVTLGETIKLRAELTGFDGLTYLAQWQVNKTGGANDWQDVPGATGLTHEYEATAESLTYTWRLAVDVA